MKAGVKWSTELSRVSSLVKNKFACARGSQKGSCVCTALYAGMHAHDLHEALRSSTRICHQFGARWVVATCTCTCYMHSPVGHGCTATVPAHSSSQSYAYTRGSRMRQDLRLTICDSRKYKTQLRIYDSSVRYFSVVLKV